METVSENARFGGMRGVYRRASAATGCEASFIKDHIRRHAERL